ncbi:MAG: OsmC family protein [Bacteroidia bacterium]|nr:OsmC family protein [Bacteroidia bacterium]
MIHKESITTSWTGNMTFETEVNGHKITLDASSEGGGENKGPRPKLLLLSALGGCTGMDVISILKKMRVEVDDFKVIVEGDVMEEHPKYFFRMHVIYQFKGKDLALDKLQEAVSLSEERYCGVSATFRKGIEVTSEIKVL